MGGQPPPKIKSKTLGLWVFLAIKWTRGFGFKPPALHLNFWEILEISGQRRRGRTRVQSPGLPSDMPRPAIFIK
jgi:hypothetical protein